MPRQTIADAALELLGTSRAATSEELAGPIAAAGLTRAASPTNAVTRALGDDPRFRRLHDGRWVVPAQLLEQAIFTHRPTPQETAHDALALLPDLAPVMAVGVFGLRMAEGTPLANLWDAEAGTLTGIDTDAALQGPPGWLGGADGGTLLHIRLMERTIEVTWGPEPNATTRMSSRCIVETVRRELDDQRRDVLLGLPPTVALAEVLLKMLVGAPEILREPLAPLAELFDGTGLEVHRGWVGHTGTDWEMLDEFMDFDDDWDDVGVEHLAALPGELTEDDILDLEDDDEDALSARLADELGLREGEMQGLQIVLGAYELHRYGHAIQDPAMLDRLATLTCEPGVASVLAVFAPREEGFEPFLSDIERGAQGSAAAGPRFVSAACAEARDDVLEAERRLQSALAADPAYRPAAIELARYRTDRGAYGDALRLLRGAGVPPDDPERAWLEEVGTSAIPKVGRNDPCPCGSGRKYKTCHLGREADAGFVDPARALLHKLWLWLEQPPGRRLIGDLKLEVVPDSARPQRDEDERDGIDGPILDDVILFDRGEIERFLRVRDVLLPESESELGRSWLETRRSLYEVRAVQAGTGLTVQDLLSDGREIELHDRSLSRQVERLDLLCLRLVADGSGGQTPSAGLLIPRGQRARLTEIIRTGDPMSLLRWLARPQAMPELANMEGEPLRLVTITYRVPDPDAAAVALGRKLEEASQGRFVEKIERNGQDWIRGSITLDGDVATLEANSTRRADRLERTLRRAAPGSRLIRREEQGMEEAMEAYQEADRDTETTAADTSIDLASNPDVAAALDQVMRQYEARWVDEAIPALGGLTPRQALKDAVMRRELESLLADMEWQLGRGGAGATMDPHRIRVLLGIR